jgi:hypothetical protein
MSAKQSEIAELRRIKEAALELVRLEDERTSISMSRDYHRAYEVNAKFYEAWAAFRKALAA